MNQKMKSPITKQNAWMYKVEDGTPLPRCRWRQMKLGFGGGYGVFE